MLISLQIKNFILIDSVRLDFQKGFYVITGETGSGKSVLLDALLFVLGEKFDIDPVKQGAEMTSVSAEFHFPQDLIPILQEHGIEPQDTLIIKRQQSAGGMRKKFFVNDEPVTSKLLNIISAELLEMHGQHSHSTLLDASKHIYILDQFGSLQPNVSETSKKYSTWQKLERDILELEQNRERVLREIDFLSFAVKELSEKSPQIGEETELADLRIKLQNSSKHRDLVQSISHMIDKYGIAQNIGSVQRTIERGTKDERFGNVLEHLNQAFAYMSEAESAIERLKDEDMEGNLDVIETRLFEIRALARKYNVTADELPAYFEKSKAELAKLESRVESLEDMQNNVHLLKKEYINTAKILSDRRKKTATALEAKIQSELTPLKMAGCKWIIEITEKDEKNFSSDGIDIVRFTAATNPGMPSGPIDKIASGGELARLMLAVKVALFDKFSKPTIIFDEIDTGIGGRVADAIGDRLKTLSEVAQVIVITHQPQVVAKSDFHILVTKNTTQDHTSSSARIIDMDDKKAEIARMLSGKSVSAGAIAAAEELMSQ